MFLKIDKIVQVIKGLMSRMQPIHWVSIVLLIICGSILYLHEALKIEKPLTHEDSTVLVVLNVTLESQKKIKIVFNSDVDAHQLEHYVTVNPSSGGKIIHGSRHNEFYFENSENFPFATTVHVEISEELVNTKGLSLIGDKTFFLQTAIGNGQVTFEKDGIFARVLSGSPGVPIPLEIKSGGGVYNPTVTVYKSTKADLLNFLLYTVKESAIEGYGKYDSYAVNFTNSDIPHSKSAVVESFEVKGTQKKDFILESGIYYLEATRGKKLFGSTFLVVSKAGIIFRQDDKKVILSAFDTKTGQKISENVDAGFYDLRNVPTLLERVVFNDVATINTPFEKKLDVILATIGTETVLVPVKIAESLADIRVNKNLDRDMQMFIYTDRPIYKPGDTVFYRGTIRMDNDALYKLPNEGLKLRVSTDPTLKYNTLVDVDKNGLFSGSFILPKDANGDFQRLSVTLENVEEGRIDYDNFAQAYFAVKKYEKPTFELTLAKEKEEYYRHEKITLKVKGTYFDSKPLSKEKVDYSLYNYNFYEQEKSVYNQNFNILAQGGMCGGSGFGDYYGELLKKGTVSLDSTGTGEVVIDLKKLKLPSTSQTLTFTASKKDTKSNNLIQTAIKAVVHAGAYSIFFIPSPSQYAVGEEMVVPFYIDSSVTSDKYPKEVEYEIRTTLYESGKSKEEILGSGKVSIGDNTKGVIKQKVPNVPYALSVLVRAQDANGNKIESSKWIGVYKKENENNNGQEGNQLQTYLKIISDKNSYIVGDTISLHITSVKDLDVLLSPERGRMYQTKIIHLNKGENTVEIPVTNDMSPSITLTFSFFADGRYYTEGVSLNVPAMHKLLQVQIEKDKDLYKPNETANLTVTIKDAKGNPVSGIFSLGIVDEAIYGLRKDATPLVHSSFYFKRERSTNASSSLTMIGRFDYGGRGGGGDGAGGNGQSVDTLFWAPTLQTDENGKVVVPVKLNDAQTIWRAQVIASDAQTNLGQAFIKLQVKN